MARSGGPTVRCLPELLDRSAAGRPEATALVVDGASLSYGALAEESNRVARWLRGAGVQRGDRVALGLPKSASALAALYGILKAGAAYVPVDLTAPASRIAFILRDCAVRHLVTTSRVLGPLLRLPAGAVSPLAVLLADDVPPDHGAVHRVFPWTSLHAVPSHDAAAPAPAPADDLAYVLYTSGSTGEPKGVAISHRAALAFVDWAVRTLALRAEDRLANHAPYHFDLSVLDLFGAAAVGASVVAVPDAIAPFPQPLAALIHGQNVSVWYSVPSALVRLVTAGRLERFDFPRLRHVLFAGEVFPVRHLRDLMGRWPHAQFWNLYGPTETNVCTYQRVSADDPPEVPVPIGRACDHAEVFAVTETGGIAGPGEVGELLVGGPSLMRGYWGRPAASAEVLVADPRRIGDPHPVYRTGDLARVNPDGTYSFLGRRDLMVKSRGYRVELGEIEAVLHRHPDLREAAAVAIPDEEIGHRLWAVVVAREGSGVGAQAVRRHCAAHLPRYMVPERVDMRPALPRTSNGKLDRRALLTEATRGIDAMPRDGELASP